MTELINPSLSPSVNKYIISNNLKQFSAKKILKNNILAFPLLMLFAFVSWYACWLTDLFAEENGKRFFITIAWFFVLVFGGFQTWNMSKEYSTFDYLWAKSKASFKGVLLISKDAKFGLIKRNIGIGGPYWSVVLSPEFDDIIFEENSPNYKVCKNNTWYSFSSQGEGRLMKLGD